MKFSLRWLGRHVDVSGVHPRDFVRYVTLSVCEVEGIETHGDGLEDVVVARIRAVAPHPTSTRLHVCDVDDGERIRRVVCGAPNAREGLSTALAKPGTVVRGRAIDVAEIGGVRSEGVLCSPAELGLTADASGLCELAPTAPGTPLDAIVPLRDVVFEVDNKSLTHRPDLWGHYGMAREIAAWLGRPLLPPETDVPLGHAAAADVAVADPEACPRYCALRLRVPRVGPAPLWVQAYLHRAGMRPIDSVVDATNFVMLELGNPLHAFDLREVRGGAIRVRRAREDEGVVTLDGQARTLRASDLLICDGERPVALAGVMGLQLSEIRTDTTDLLLEAATFRAEVTRRTAVHLGLRTEASARFEKSLDPDLPPVAARRFAKLLLDIVPGAQVTSGLTDVSAGRAPLPVITTSIAYLNARLGTDLPAHDIVGKLRSLQFGVEAHEDGTLRVHVPGWRATKDVSIAEDLVEEVGRLHGYDNIVPQHPATAMPRPFRHPMRTLAHRARLALSLSAGFTEVQSYAFDPEPLLARTGAAGVPRVALRNPISSDYTHLRPHVLPSLFASLELSRAHADRLDLYEIGRVFHPRAGEVADQPYRLGLLRWRADGPDDWAEAQRAAFAALKDTIAHVAERLGVTLRFARTLAPLPWLHPVRVADVALPDGRVVGSAGALHPRVADALGVAGWAAAAELDLDLVLAAAPDRYGYAPVRRHPSVEADVSVIVPLTVTYAEVDARLRGAHASWVRRVDFVADFRGAPIPEGHKSLTFRLVFQADDRTLAMEEVRAAVDDAVTRIGADLGGWIRT